MQLKEILKKGTHKVLLLPMHKSYIDWIMISYILYYHAIDLPFVAGNEYFINITVLTRVLRKLGGFFVDEKQASNPLYQTILREYISAILGKKYMIEMFLEGHRSKTGKVGKPAALEVF